MLNTSFHLMFKGLLECKLKCLLECKLKGLLECKLKGLLECKLKHLLVGANIVECKTRYILGLYLLYILAVFVR